MDEMEMEAKYNSKTVEDEGLKRIPNRIVTEQSAEIVAGGHVFYNPVQEFNRDLSICVLNVYFRRLVKERQERAAAGKNSGKNAAAESKEKEFVKYTERHKYADGMRILEALSATGLRSIRYAKEVAGVKEIVANDLSNAAVESIRENVRHNGVEHLVEPSRADAMTLMYTSTSPEKRFDVIDLDPYGCPNRFLDGAMQSIVDGGLLLITATDMAVLAGNMPEACFAKYGSVPLRSKCCHEMALRILLHCLENHANRYGKYIEPLLSISADFYVRVFVRVHTSQAKCKFSMSKQSMVFQCTGCETLTPFPLGNFKPNPTEKNPNQVKFGIPTGPPVGTSCEHCGHKHHLGGPIWSHHLHDREFVEELLQSVGKDPLCNLGTQRRIIGMLSVISEELLDIPLYYALDKMCCVLKLESVPVLKFRSALLHEGYRVSFSHACKNSVKTDAPAGVLWDILRCWSKRHPVKKDRIVDGTPLKTILNKPSEKDYNFDDIHPDANPYSRRNALSRFQTNPTSHWGPGTRSTIMVGEDKIAKSFRNQNKNCKQKGTISNEVGQDKRRKVMTPEEDNANSSLIDDEEANSVNK